MDTIPLYTVIPNGEGFQALNHFFDQRTVKEPSSETLLYLVKLVLSLNCNSFGGNYYNQNCWRSHRYWNGTQLRQSFRRFYRTLIFQSTQRPQSWTLLSLNWQLRLSWKGAHSIYNPCQFLSNGSEIYLGNFFRHHVQINSIASFSEYKQTTHNSSIRSDEGLTLERQLLNLYGSQSTLSTRLIMLNYPVIHSHRRSTTVSSETYPLYSFKGRS